MAKHGPSEAVEDVVRVEQLLETGAENIEDTEGIALAGDVDVMGT